MLDFPGTGLADASVSSTHDRQAVPLNPETCYDGSNPIFRLLRLETWGSPLMNLGYFRFRGPFAFLNVLAKLERAQRRLVIKSIGLLQVKREQRVLDLACGREKSSFIMHCLHPQSAVVGVDLVDRHIQVARTLFGGSRHLSYATGNAMCLEFPDASFHWKNPLFRSFSRDDWAACHTAVRAHQHVQRHSKYMAFVFEKSVNVTRPLC